MLVLYWDTRISRKVKPVNVILTLPLFTPTLIKTFLSILEILRIETYFKQLIIGKI